MDSRPLFRYRYRAIYFRRYRDAIDIVRCSRQRDTDNYRDTGLSVLSSNHSGQLKLVISRVGRFVVKTVLTWSKLVKTGKNGQNW
jgi:hypothetical protein